MNNFRAAVFFLLMGISTLAKGQIALEKAYDFSTICPTCTTKVEFFNTELKSYFYLVIDNAIQIFNQDHTLYKEINTTSTDEIFLKVYLPSDKLFNNDDLIEFLVLTKTTTDGGYPVSYSFLLMNENGVVSSTLGEAGCEYGYSTRDNYVHYFKTVDNKSKIIINSSESFCNSVLVYSVPGILTEVQENILRSQGLSIFPNPARNNVTIKTDDSSLSSILQITDINGNLVQQVLIEPYQKEKTINISNLAPGIYVYCNGNNTGKFIVR